MLSFLVGVYVCRLLHLASLHEYNERYLNVYERYTDDGLAIQQVPKVSFEKASQLLSYFSSSSEGRSDHGGRNQQKLQPVTVCPLRIIRIFLL